MANPKKFPAPHDLGLPVANGWAARLNAALMDLPAQPSRSLVAAVRAEAFKKGIWIEEDGRKQPIEVALRPPLVDLAARGYLHHVAWQVRVGLRRCVQLVAQDPQAAKLMPLDEREREWFDRYRRPGSKHGTQRLFCRLDALGSLEGPGWRERLKFIEANVIGVGGMSYSPPAEDVIFELVLPQLLDSHTDMEFDRNADPAHLLLDELVHHAHLNGVTGEPTVAFVDDHSLYTLGGEFGRLVPHLRSCGLDAIYVDPRELTLAGNGDIVAEGRRVDLVYRFLALSDFVALEEAGADLSAMRAALERNIVVPGVGGDLEHKSVFELLTNPQFTASFEPELQQVLAEHVLWTRLLFERRTAGPDGSDVDLVDYVGRHRRDLVIKPNRSAGGAGVVIGSLVSQSQWEHALEDAMSRPGDHVVQAVADPVAEAFPVWVDGQLELDSRYCAAGLFPGRTGLGIFGRFSSSPVVNIHAGGGIAAYLVSVQ